MTGPLTSLSPQARKASLSFGFRRTCWFPETQVSKAQAQGMASASSCFFLSLDFSGPWQADSYLAIFIATPNSHFPPPGTFRPCRQVLKVTRPQGQRGHIQGLQILFWGLWHMSPRRKTKGSPLGEGAVRDLWAQLWLPEYLWSQHAPQYRLGHLNMAISFQCKKRA